jgi:hypothetical protein
MTISLSEVVIFSVLGVALATASFAMLLHKSRRPIRHFGWLCITVLAVYAFGPPSAMMAPYMEGAARFNWTTLVATEVMHLFSVGCCFLLLTSVLGPHSVRSTTMATFAKFCL